MDYFIRPWRLYAEPTGRATRREYGAFLLTAGGAIALALALSALAAARLEPIERHQDAVAGLTMLALLGFVLLFGAAPLAAVTARRLHDLGRSGWWLPAGLAGWPLLLLLPGSPGTNRFGIDPRAPRRARVAATIVKITTSSPKMKIG
ncbi:DUF805 domain-containing protein [Sphingomonas sp. BK235]|uniref:DUF805 domain-containing protein n=1 Tax=Sphingomonas sp. BK235 TaxID=2512131 RepID=UPI001050F2A5|nr:DUF805 domain-containing protein [Sphingomonas sp. BK235]TCP33793.1 uncharacterized membrane protein YhaH (DUF805 family) [Sphingomonas sp. BK235]